MTESIKFSRARLLKAARLINQLEHEETRLRLEAAHAWEEFDATPNLSRGYRAARDKVRKADDAYVEIRKLADEIRKELGHE